jgi:hypothetical protein
MNFLKSNKHRLKLCLLRNSHLKNQIPNTQKTTFIKAI